MPFDRGRAEEQLRAANRPSWPRAARARTVNLPARIAGRAGAGQVLVAAAEPVGARFEALGPVRLKGFTRPVRLHLALPA